MRSHESERAGRTVQAAAAWVWAEGLVPWVGDAPGAGYRRPV